MLNSTLRFIQKLWILTVVGVAIYACEPALAVSGPGDVVGKVTVGYQAWFGAIGDGSPQNDWWHWADNGGQIFSPTNAQDADSWPDMTDYTVSYQTGFANLGNGQPAKVFSSYDQSTVNAQISWMQQNGIDTIALQRFNPNSGETNRDGEAARTNNAAITYGRKWFVMYDITGWETMDTDLKTDWTNKMKAYTSSSAYAMQNGKPVVCVWLATSDRPVSELVDIVNWLKGQGLYVIIGVERTWRADTAKLPVINAANMIQPWLIGSIGNISDADNIYNSLMIGDEAYCVANGLDYQAVVLPGDLHLHQRVHGNLMWEMFYNAVRVPAQGIYISMYDEYGEGNMIAKTPDTSAGIPVGSTYIPLNEDGTYCTTDYYLRLTGAGGRMLKGLMPLSVVRPTNPGGAQRLVPGAVIALKSVVSGAYVCGSPLLANCTTVGQQESYQVVDAGNGNIALLSLANNEYVAAANGGASSLTANQSSVGSAETFTEVDAGNGNIGLLASANGEYVSAGNAGASPLTANSTTVGSPDSFTVVAGTSAPPQTGPYGGTPAAIPGTVLAENYDLGGQGVGYSVSSVNGTDDAYRSDGVNLETATAPATGNDLGWTASGQWFNYTVNVATAGKYNVTFEVAAPSAVTDAFHLSNSTGTNLSGTVNISASGGWQTWTTVTASVTLPAGKQTLTLDEDSSGWNIDSAAFALVTPAEGPYGGTPAAIPGTVQAENYDTGGQGVGYSVSSINGSGDSYRSDGVDLETTSDTGGGYDLGWTTSGQWFKYTVNVATAGTYTVSFRVAAPSTVTDAFHVTNSSGTNLSGSVNIPATGGWQTWATVTASVTLAAGQQVLTLDEDNAGWNINDIAFASPAHLPLVLINCGGAASGSWVADTDFSGGTAVTSTNTITTSGVTNPAPQAVYQSNRYNAPSYTIGGLTAGTSYIVRLHFAETYWTAAGKRTFNVSINGAQVLTNFDIFATAGGEYIANVQQFTATANSSGQIVITSTNVVDNAQFNGIEIDQ